MVATRYAFIRGCTIWDIPGLGTEANKAGIYGERYFKQHYLRWYHYLFIITSVRIFKTDQSIIRILENNDQPFTIIRTKMDEVNLSLLNLFRFLCLEDISNALQDIEMSIAACKIAMRNELITKEAREHAEKDLPDYEEKRDKIVATTIAKVQNLV